MVASGPQELLSNDMCTWCRCNLDTSWPWRLLCWWCLDHKVCGMSHVYLVSVGARSTRDNCNLLLGSGYTEHRKRLLANKRNMQTMSNTDQLAYFLKVEGC